MVVISVSCILSHQQIQGHCDSLITPEVAFPFCRLGTWPMQDGLALWRCWMFKYRMGDPRWSSLPVLVYSIRIHVQDSDPDIVCIQWWSFHHIAILLIPINQGVTSVVPYTPRTNMNWLSIENELVQKCVEPYDFNVFVSTSKWLSLECLGRHWQGASLGCRLWSWTMLSNDGC